MIEAVILFGFMNVVFEFVLLSMIAPRYRLRVLGSPTLRNLLHVTFLTVNLVIHWGTLIGTMSAVLAFISSMVTVAIASKLYGTIVDSTYTIGYFKYDIKELQ